MERSKCKSVCTFPPERLEHYTSRLRRPHQWLGKVWAKRAKESTNSAEFCEIRGSHSGMIDDASLFSRVTPYNCVNGTRHCETIVAFSSSGSSGPRRMYCLTLKLKAVLKTSVTTHPETQRHTQKDFKFSCILFVFLNLHHLPYAFPSARIRWESILKTYVERF